METWMVSQELRFQDSTTGKKPVWKRMVNMIQSNEIDLLNYLCVWWHPLTITSHGSSRSRSLEMVYNKAIVQAEIRELKKFAEASSLREFRSL